ncbi:MAG: PmoA family protein, partial [Verrucomicrobiales bacterium]
MHTLSRLIPLISLSTVLVASAQEAAVSIKSKPDRATVRIGDSPFAELLFGADRAKPVLYPVFGPHQVRMTRDFPFKDSTKGEKHDHPHHESLWYTHGDVNGISFWHLGKDAGTIKQTELAVDGDTISTSNEWLSPKGKRVCTDQRKMKFSALPGGARLIDFTVTIEASDGDVKFGDTKEGSMGIRTNPLLRTDKGAEVANSAGQKGKAIWGKPAKWVNYQSKIDGNPVGVAIFDSPNNPRHPSTWHARDYGLVAANPFGAHDFSGAKKGAGDLTIKSGESVTFHYAFVFHNGSDEEQSIEDLYQT